MYRGLDSRSTSGLLGSAAQARRLEERPGRPAGRRSIDEHLESGDGRVWRYQRPDARPERPHRHRPYQRTAAVRAVAWETGRGRNGERHVTGNIYVPTCSTSILESRNLQTVRIAPGPTSQHPPIPKTREPVDADDDVMRIDGMRRSASRGIVRSSTHSRAITPLFGEADHASDCTRTDGGFGPRGQVQLDVRFGRGSHDDRRSAYRDDAGRGASAVLGDVAGASGARDRDVVALGRGDPEVVRARGDRGERPGGEQRWCSKSPA